MESSLYRLQLNNIVLSSNSDFKTGKIMESPLYKVVVVELPPTSIWSKKFGKSPENVQIGSL